MRRVLITGANRGIGLRLAELAIARGDQVIATARRPEHAERLRALAALTGKLRVQQADVTDDASMRGLQAALAGEALDLVVCNAGVLGTYGQLGAAELDAGLWQEVLLTNVYGPFATARASRDALRAGTEPKLAIIASAMGSSTRAIEKGNAYPYRAAKAGAVNLARNLAAELKGDGIAVGAYHPGWVRTDMGGPGADIDVDESAGGLLARFEALTLARTGVFEDYRGEPVPF
ncbi:MAG: SDR family oxidoreductase [Neomegalonema sp.]|nr:SDR family oxidoreductase [Neomegalonema sp.]